MKVYVIKSNHGMYKDLLKFPPVDYIILERGTLWGYVLKKLSLIKISESKFHTKKDYLIHAHQRIVKNKQSWVVDQSHAQLFIDSKNYWKLKDKKYTKKVEKHLNSKYCKKIMATSYAAKKSIEQYFHIKDKSKLVVVYPAIHKEKAIKNRKKIRKFLFVSNKRKENCWVKGGRETIKAFNNLKEKRVTLTYIGWVPKEIKKRYNKNITYVEPKFSKTELDKIYQTHDAFVQPTLCDLFGYVFLEAMSHELPIISTNNYAQKEMIINNKTGIVVKSNIHLHEETTKYKNFKEFVNFLKRNEQKELIKNIENAVLKLIDNPKLIKKIRKNQRNIIKNGKFSIKERNKKLKQIYEDATK